MRCIGTTSARVKSATGWNSNTVALAMREERAWSELPIELRLAWSGVLTNPELAAASFREIGTPSWRHMNADPTTGVAVAKRREAAAGRTICRRRSFSLALRSPEAGESGTLDWCVEVWH